MPKVSSTGMESAVAAAIHRSRTALEEDRRDPSRWGHFAMVLHAHRLRGPAELAYTEAARLDGEDHRWPHLLGRLLEGGEPGPALRHAEEALRREPRFSPSLALRARLLEASGNGDAAGAAWESLRQAAPGSVEAPLALGRSRLSRGDLPGALAEFERVTDRLPSSVAGWSFLSHVRRRLGDPEGASEAAARARAAAHSPSLGITADPDPLLIAVEDLRADSRGREARARRAAATGDYRTAETIYRSLAADRPDDPVLHYNLANSLARQGRDRAAEAAYRAALERNPDSSPAMSNLANLLARQGRDEEAAHLYRRSARSDPNHLPTLLGASSLAFQRGGLREAERLLLQVLALDPNHPAALQGLGQLLATVGRLSDSEAAFTRALAAAEEAGAAPGRRAELHFLLADVNRRQRRYRDALLHLDEAEALGMEIPEAFRDELGNRR